MCNQTPSKEDLKNFLKDEFAENWSYLRHIEEIRLKHTNLYLLIVGAFISSLSFLSKSAPKDSSVSLTTFLVAEYSPIILFGSLFIFLYGLSLSTFLSQQKRGYEHYRKVNAEIRNFFAGKESNDFSFETELPVNRSVKSVIKSTFFYWYLLTVFIDLIAFIIFITSLIEYLSPGGTDYGTAFTSILVLIYVFVFAIQVYVFVSNNTKIYTAPG